MFFFQSETTHLNPLPSFLCDCLVVRCSCSVSILQANMVDAGFLYVSASSQHWGY